MTTVVLLLTYAPLYFRNILKFGVEETGILVSLSASIHLPLKMAFGFISDYMKYAMMVMFSEKKNELYRFNGLKGEIMENCSKVGELIIFLSGYTMRMREPRVSLDFQMRPRNLANAILQHDSCWCCRSILSTDWYYTC